MLSGFKSRLATFSTSCRYCRPYEIWQKRNFITLSLSLLHSLPKLFCNNSASLLILLRTKSWTYWFGLKIQLSSLAISTIAPISANCIIRYIFSHLLDSNQISALTTLGWRSLLQISISSYIVSYRDLIPSEAEGFSSVGAIETLTNYFRVCFSYTLSAYTIRSSSG